MNLYNCSNCPNKVTWIPDTSWGSDYNDGRWVHYNPDYPQCDKPNYDGDITSNVMTLSEAVKLTQK